MTAQELIDLRKRMHWSQIEAARQLDCSPRAIADWEEGIMPIPNSIALAASAAVLNICWDRQ